MRRHLGLALATSSAVLVAASLLAPAGAATPVASPPGDRAAACPQLQLADRWYGDNAATIQRAIDRRGRCSWTDGQEPTHAPYAVFDWDNTMIKNDISDQTIFWMLGHDKILQPPNRGWRATSRYLTDEGALALRRACGTLARPGTPLPTSSPTRSSVRCADELLSVRKEQETTGGDPVFAGYHHRRMEAGYAWVGQILQGHTPAQVRQIAARARTAALEAPKGATQRVAPAARPPGSATTRSCATW